MVRKRLTRFAYFSTFQRLVAGTRLRTSRFSARNPPAASAPVNSRFAASMASITHAPAASAAAHLVSRNSPIYCPTESESVVRISAGADCHAARKRPQAIARMAVNKVYAV